MWPCFSWCVRQTWSLLLEGWHSDLHPAERVGWWHCALSTWRALLLLRLSQMEAGGKPLKPVTSPSFLFQLSQLISASSLVNLPCKPGVWCWLCAAQWGHRAVLSRSILAFHQLTSPCSPGCSASYSCPCLYHVKLIAGMKALFNSYFIPHLPVHVKLIVYVLHCCNEKDLYCYKE